jgi:hypothetical protein
MNICARLDCETVGELATVFRVEGAEFISNRRNCGKKTLAELSAVVDGLSVDSSEPRCAFSEATIRDANTCGDASNNEALGFTADELLEAIERLQIPYGFPIEFIRLPIRIHKWCNSRDWKTLGSLLHNVGGMALPDLLAVDNIGRKSAIDVLMFFDALKVPRPAELRKFLPLAPNSTSFSLAEGLNHTVDALDARDVRMLEMRLIGVGSLESIAHDFNCTRELVRQIEGRFLRKVEHILSWFSDKRVELWQHWELTDNLAPVVSQAGVAPGTMLVAAAISSVFERTPEGKMMQEHWQKTFQEWGRELISSGSLLSDGADLADFAKRKGSHYLERRFQSWLGKHFGDVLSVVESRVIQFGGDLSSEQRALLYGGEILELRWHNQYERLKQYHAEHGNADVPSGWKADPQLAAWVCNQRERRRRGAMSNEELELLDELNLRWQSRDVGTWEDRFAEVVAFKAGHGHCEIPTVFRQNPKLGRFVNAMRTQKNRGSLSVDRIAKLDAIGFAWASTRRTVVRLGEQMVSKVWRSRYDELMAYKDSHGDCDVPAKWKQNQALANWVSRQRQFKKCDALSESCVKLLESAGFNWRANHDQQSWDVRYAELLKFKETHGHCDVAVKYLENPSLGVWVVIQRSKNKRGKLTPEQVHLLTLAGFTWQMRRGVTPHANIASNSQDTINS